MAILRLIALRCNRQEDWTGDDDTYITLNGEQIDRQRYDDGQTRAINKDRSFVSQVEIKLYEYDSADPDDFLGSRVVTRDEADQGEKQVNFSASGASYDLWYIVFPDPPRESSAEIVKKYSAPKT